MLDKRSELFLISCLSLFAARGSDFIQAFDLAKAEKRAKSDFYLTVVCFHQCFICILKYRIRKGGWLLVNLTLFAR